MADRSLRGMRLGAQSLQSEEGVAFSPRKKSMYQPADGSTFEVMFSADAEIPTVWESPKSGQEGRLLDDDGASGRARGRRRPRFRAATGTCCSSVAPAPSSKSCSRSASTSCAPAEGQHKIGA